MLKYVVIDKQTNKEVSTLDVLLEEEPDYFQDHKDWDGVFCLSPMGALWIEGVDPICEDEDQLSHILIDNDRYEAVLKQVDDKK